MLRHERLARVVTPGTRLVATVAGPKMMVDPESAFGLEVAGTLTYEPRMTALLGALLRPGDTFVDIGANEGWFSVLASRLVGSRGRVVAVEPQGAVQRRLERNLDLNGSSSRSPGSIDQGAGSGRAPVCVARVALMAAPGSVLLHVAGAANPGATSIHDYQGDLPTERVPATTLDVLWSEQALGVARLVKIDVEGAEGDVIAGATRTLEAGRVRALALEFHTNILSLPACEAIDQALRATGLLLTKVRGLHVYHWPGVERDLRDRPELEPVKPLCDWHGRTTAI